MPFFSLIGHSQTKSSTILDEKNGFKEFKLDDQYSKWSAEIKFTNSEDEGKKYYDYTGNCCQKLFNSELRKIRLGFKYNVLNLIYLVTPTEKQVGEDYLSAEYKYLKSSFDLLFQQKGYEAMPDDNSGDVQSIWMGNKIQLILTYEYMGIKDFDGKYIATSRCNVLISKISNLNDGF